MIYYWFPFKFPFLLGLTSFYFTPTCINPSYRSFFPLSLASNFKHFLHRKTVTFFFKLQDLLKRKYKRHHDFWNISWQPAIAEFLSEQTVRWGAEMPTWPLWSLWAKPPAYLISSGNEVVNTYSGYLVIRCFVCRGHMFLNWCCLFLWVFTMSAGCWPIAWRDQSLGPVFLAQIHILFSPSSNYCHYCHWLPVGRRCQPSWRTEPLRCPGQQKAGCG